MALVPCRQCRQPFYASCHDASCLDALCPYCADAAPALDDHLLVEGGRTGEGGAGDMSDALVVSRETMRVQHPGPPTRGEQG